MSLNAGNLLTEPLGPLNTQSVSPIYSLLHALPLCGPLYSQTMLFICPVFCALPHVCAAGGSQRGRCAWREEGCCGEVGADWDEPAVLLMGVCQSVQVCLSAAHSFPLLPLLHVLITVVTQ